MSIREPAREGTMRKLLVGVALAALSTTAAAGTLDEVVKHGIVILLPNNPIDVTYTPDGKFTAAGGQVTGTWRIDGDALCTTSNVDPTETCVPYPKDKKSGDTFEVTGPTGTATVKIN
jgi:hypothetical protein